MNQSIINRCLFLDRLQGQAELVKLLDKSMKDKKTITFEEFVHITEDESSMIYLCVSLILEL